MGNVYRSKEREEEREVEVLQKAESVVGRES